MVYGGGHWSSLLAEAAMGRLCMAVWSVWEALMTPGHVVGDRRAGVMGWRVETVSWVPG